MRDSIWSFVACLCVLHTDSSNTPLQLASGGPGLIAPELSIARLGWWPDKMTDGGCLCSRDVLDFYKVSPDLLTLWGTRLSCFDGATLDCASSNNWPGSFPLASSRSGIVLVPLCILTNNVAYPLIWYVLLVSCCWWTHCQWNCPFVLVCVVVDVPFL